jgi:hypothetical protein
MSAPASVPFRIGVFVTGYLFATVVAAVAYTLLIMISARMIGIEQPSEMTVAEGTRFLAGFAILVWCFVVTTSFVPAIFAVVLIGLVGLRDVVSHMVAGAAVSASAVLITARTIPFMNELTLDWAIALSGAIAGVAFWWLQRKLLPRGPKTSATSPAP